MAEQKRVAGTEIVATASTEYRVKRFIMVVLLVGWGLWSVYDGYVKYPRENAEQRAVDPKIAKLPHTETDIFLNKLIGWVLPPAGLLVLGWALWNSRGQIRLRDKVLSAPGHPPVSLAAVRSIDRTDWDRKGIAYINYELANGRSGSLRLDDFIYQREPVDAIFTTIEKLLTPDDTADDEKTQPADTGKAEE